MVPVAVCARSVVSLNAVGFHDKANCMGKIQNCDTHWHQLGSTGMHKVYKRTQAASVSHMIQHKRMQDGENSLTLQDSNGRFDAHPLLVQTHAHRT